MSKTPRALKFLLPGELSTRTGGYGYDRRIIAGLRDLGWQVEVVELDGSYPLPTPAALAQTQAVLSKFVEGSIVLVDGLAFGAMPGIAETERIRLKLVSLVHHPLAFETGIDERQKLVFEDEERRALAATRAVVVTSEATLRLMVDYAVPMDRITVVEPGTDPAPIAPGSGSQTLELLCVASLTPRKGHDVLIAALADLQEHVWHLTCVGGPLQDDGTRHLHAQLAEFGMTARVTFAGEGDDAEVNAAYACADVFVLPTHYEGYGMVVAEALARGLPVVSTRTGAIPDLVGDRAGLIVPPGDVQGLANALRRLFEEPALLPGLREGALAARNRLPRWEDSCAKLSGLLDSIARA